VLGSGIDVVTTLSLFTGNCGGGVTVDGDGFGAVVGMRTTALE
jgi:hypothetical protein